MTKEQGEALDYIQKQINYYKEQIKFIEAVDSDYYDEEYELYKNRTKQFSTVLSLIKENQTEIEKYKALYDRALSDVVKADKQIDLMAKFIENNMSEKKIINEICIKGKCNNEECHEDDLKDCIKQYFERKVEEC